MKLLLKKIFFLSIILPLISFSQTREEIKLCMALQGNNFSSDYEAEKTLDQILNIIGAKKNFVLI